MNDLVIRPARPGDQAGAYYVCLKTGDFGKDGEPFYREDPDALGRSLRRTLNPAPMPVS